jgi:hypothetical protein
MTTSSSMASPAIICPDWCQLAPGDHERDESEVEHVRTVAVAGHEIKATLWTRRDGTTDNDMAHEVMLETLDLTLKEAVDLGFQLSNIAFRIAHEAGSGHPESFMADDHARARGARR